MNSILEDLFYGELNPSLNQGSHDSDYQEALDTVVNNEAKLIKILEGKEKELFSKYANAWALVDGAAMADSFVLGFKMGVKMVSEALVDKTI